MRKMKIKSSFVKAFFLIILLVYINPNMPISYSQNPATLQMQVERLKNQQNPTTGLVDSYNDGQHIAYIYTQALPIIAFTHAGEEERAQMILQRMGELQLPSGAWHAAYQNTEQFNIVFDELDSGNIAWVVMAINYYEIHTGDHSYATMAGNALNWIDTMMITDPSDHDKFGAIRFSDKNPNLISTEKNLDVYSAYRWRGEISGNQTYFEKATLIRDFLFREMWAPSPRSNGLHKDYVFWTGFNDSGLDCALYTDCQSWSVLIFGKRGPYMMEPIYLSLDWLWEHLAEGTRNTQYFDTYNVWIDAFKPSVADVNHIWVGGTEGVASAFYFAADSYNVPLWGTRADYLHGEIAQIIGVDGGISHSFREIEPLNLVWPYNYRYDSVESIAWFYFTEMKINPFMPIPIPEIDDIKKSGNDIVIEWHGNPNGPIVSLYTSDAPDGPWSEHPIYKNLQPNGQMQELILSDALMNDQKYYLFKISEPYAGQ
jgi:hypothetical protein